MKSYSKREFVRLLKNNGYTYVRRKGGHSIYNNGVSQIVIPDNIRIVIAQRLIKEYKLRT